MKSVQTVKKKNERQFLQKKSAVVSNRNVFISHNFSDVEDAKDAFRTIGSIVSIAGKNAATEAKAKGLNRTYIRNFKKLVRVSATGAEVVLTPQIKREAYYIKYKPHTILHAVKK